MPNKMLIDTTHPEETRVVVLRGSRVEEFDFESANRRQLRGNIYLAKVTRVEPSLQAAFIDYGGNRHGFLAFSEIHPDYYQIPVADRQALIAEEERAHRDAEDEADRRASGGGGGRGRRPRRDASHSRRDPVRTQPLEGEQDSSPAAADSENAEQTFSESSEHATEGTETHGAEAGSHEPTASSEAAADAHPGRDEQAPAAEAQPAAEHAHHEDDHKDHDHGHAGHDHTAHDHHDHDGHAHHDHAEHHAEAAAGESPALTAGEHGETSTEPADAGEAHPGEGESNGNGNVTEIEDTRTTAENDEDAVEVVGGADAMEEAQERTPRYRRTYKIQEVIKRRQIMLVQVVKEERGTKGAALTTYLSLAGRYSVLMPNTARGGGISRKITNSIDRKKLKEIAQDLEVPEGMGVILRTAGANRTKTEVKRDFEYLLRLWETVRDFTLKSSAPELVYEEGSLIKRSIRDLYNKDIEEILVAGEDGHREAKDFMRMLMPSHAKNVKLYHDAQPVFTRYGIESQLDAMFTPTVQLRSGGYIVINQTEALVAIDVNSGRATREHHIEDTALKTNLEAADEVARQLRLRDLAGLIVIDFIDMDESRNNRLVERRMKEALKHDRARIQVGRISHFGLLEMSRQRIRSSVLESSTDKCPHCGGTGHVRSVSSVTLHLLRMLEEMLLKGATNNLIVRTRTEVALYVLNQKRAHLRDLESRFQITITISADATIGAAQPFMIEKGDTVHSAEAAKVIAAAQVSLAPPAEDDEDEDDFIEDDAGEEAEGDVETVGETEGESEGEDEADGDAEPSAASDAPRSSEDDAQRRGRRRRRGRGRGPREGGEPRAPGAEHAVPEHRQEAAQTNGANGHDTEDAGEDSEQSADGSANGRPPALDAEGRRRRRGRRGGRRNRRGREGEGEAPYAGADASQGPVEPDVASAVADLGGASPFEQPHEPAPRHEPRYEPAQSYEQTSFPSAAEPMAAREPVQAAQAASAELPVEPPRRRSTVREPAPMFSSGAMSDVQTSPVQEAPPPPPPAPEPVATVPEPVAAAPEAKPRRFGWWNKRS